MPVEFTAVWPVIRGVFVPVPLGARAAAIMAFFLEVLVWRRIFMAVIMPVVAVARFLAVILFTVIVLIMSVTHQHLILEYI